MIVALEQKYEYAKKKLKAIVEAAKKGQLDGDGGAAAAALETSSVHSGGSSKFTLSQLSKVCHGVRESRCERVREIVCDTGGWGHPGRAGEEERIGESEKERRMNE